MGGEKPIKLRFHSSWREKNQMLRSIADNPFVWPGMSINIRAFIGYSPVVKTGCLQNSSNHWHMNVPSLKGLP